MANKEQVKEAAAEAALKAAQEQFRQKLADFLQGKKGQLGCRRRAFKPRKTDKA